MENLRPLIRDIRPKGRPKLGRIITGRRASTIGASQHYACRHAIPQCCGAADSRTPGHGSAKRLERLSQSLPCRAARVAAAPTCSLRCGRARRVRLEDARTIGAKEHQADAEARRPGSCPQERRKPDDSTVEELDGLRAATVAQRLEQLPCGAERGGLLTEGPPQASGLLWPPLDFPVINVAPQAPTVA
jgi:hypothetical protein